MSKINPIRIADTAIKSAKKKAPKLIKSPKQECAVDLRLEERGLWEYNGEIIQQIFPR